MRKRQASKFYPYFAMNERPTIDYLVGLFNNLIFKRQDLLTDFLDPGERDILTKIAGHEANLQEFGGYPQAEKKRVYLTLRENNLPHAVFKIQPYQIQYPQKFSVLTHSSILGSLANSGVKISTFGDIVDDGKGTWQFFAEKELASFFEKQITRIGKSKVKLRPIASDLIIKPQDDSTEGKVIVNSLRLDAFLAGVSHQSRRQMQAEIKAGQVKLNWHERQNSNIMVKDNDVLSLRHFGRIKVSEIKSTRKGKYRVVLKLWQARRKH